jgi:hypothetical protein
MANLTDTQKNSIIRKMVANDYDWYALLMQDGSTDLRHKTGLSAILECGQAMEDYDIVAIYSCGKNDEDEALEALQLCDDWGA